MSDETMTNSLPPFYNSVVPLLSTLHGQLSYTAPEKPDFSFAASAPAIVLAAEEFVPAMMHYPIVFSVDAEPMPVVLTGVPGGTNQFVSADGHWRDGVYIPAYVRRYPFVLAKLAPEAQDLSLCFDENCSWLAQGEAGNLFDGNEPTETARTILAFCENYEGALARTRQFMGEIAELDLLIDAQAEIKGLSDQPILFNGFRMVSEEKLRDLRGDQYRKLAASGALALIYAHLFSMGHMMKLFETVQTKEGKGKGRLN